MEFYYIQYVKETTKYNLVGKYLLTQTNTRRYRDTPISVSNINLFVT